MTQGWIASTLPLTAEEFVNGERIRRFHYCVPVEEPRPDYKSICGQITMAGRCQVLPFWPSGRVCQRCAALYRSRIRGEVGEEMPA